MDFQTALEIMSSHFREYGDAFGPHGKDYLFRIYSHLVEGMISETRKGKN